MKKSTWNPAITVEDPDTHAWRTVKSVRQAQSLLHRHWPMPAGRRYQEAEVVCYEALHGEVGASDARKAFIAAAIEAHLHLS